MSAAEADTRIALSYAFNGPGKPRADFRDLDEDTATKFFEELALGIFQQLPRAVRRAGGDVLLSAILRAVTLGFWGGVYWTVDRDREV